MCITLNVKNMFNPKGGCMKKLLVLALVLSMATMANAALTFTISGPDTLAQGAVGTYTVSYTGGTTLGTDFDIVSDLGTIGGGIIITTNRDVSLDYVGINSATPNYEVVILNDVAATDLGSPLFSFTLTAPMVSGTATISLVENSVLALDWSQIMDSVYVSKTVLVTPEPITMTLLGLGGLFLRRRSK